MTPDFRPAPLLRRLFALAYESLLVGAVGMLAMLLVGALQTLLQHRFPALLPAVAPFAALLLLGAWWLYFKLNWLRESQTLPMRVWQIGLSAADGSRPTLPRLRVRFAWACVLLLFVPLAAYAAFRHAGIAPRTAFFAALLWWILPWGFALLNPQRQFLYDYLAGTRLEDKRAVSGSPPKNKETS
ncbi:RDD family protein [Conchiformibius kuhniae]|uniref:RDD family protein n=1 Tax=Conchiformibius kuhniae TaxID=211502 RepID=A0A8T9MVQ3_9NEIS|nr:RDD family protein [Conchiformibius kuhniae]UOP05261.1 RDD family protein [Conchiformibius kuhniae]